MSVSELSDDTSVAVVTSTEDTSVTGEDTSVPKEEPTDTREGPSATGEDTSATGNGGRTEEPSAKRAKVEPDEQEEPATSSGTIRCPYLDTIDRAVLDFDFEKLCSISLSNNNVYACLVCGKYFQVSCLHLLLLFTFVVCLYSLTLCNHMERHSIVSPATLGSRHKVLRLHPLGPLGAPRVLESSDTPFLLFAGQL